MNTMNDDACHYNGVDYVPVPETNRCEGCAFDKNQDGRSCILLSDSNVESTHCSPGVRADDRGIIWVRADAEQSDDDKPLPTIQQLFDECEIVGMCDASGEEHIATDFEVIDRYGLDMLRVEFNHHEFVIPMVAQVKERLKGGYYVVDAYVSATESRRLSLGFFTTVPVKL